MRSEHALSKDELLNVLSHSNNATNGFPRFTFDAIYMSADIVIEFVNDAMLAFWGKDKSIIGKPLEAAVTELMGQPFKKCFSRYLPAVKLFTVQYQPKRE